MNLLSVIIERGNRPERLELTEKEKEHLSWILTIGGKGYIHASKKTYQVKLLHICPECNGVGNWHNGTGNPNLTHACGKVVTWDEYLNLNRRESWFEI